MNTSNKSTNEHPNEVLTLLRDIQVHISGLEQRLARYEILLPGAKIERMSEELLLLKQWKMQQEQQNHQSKANSFTWIHAIVMVLITVILSTGANYVATPDNDTIQELKKEIELLKKEKQG